MNGAGPTPAVTQPAEPEAPPPPRFDAKKDLSDSDRAAGHYLSALLAHDERDEKVAIQQMLRAVTLDPREPMLRKQLVWLYIDNGSLNRALEHASTLKRLEPDDPEIRLLNARLYMALQRYERAIGEYRDALELDPDNVEAMIQLGAHYNRVRRHDEAAAVMETALKKNPDSAIVNYSLGRALAGSKRYNDALKALRHASRINPSNAELYLHLGLVYGELGMRRKQIEAYNKAIDFKAPLTVFEPPLEMDASEERLARFAAMVDFAEDPLDTQWKLGFVNFQRGYLGRAVADFALVLAARPGDDEVRYFLALAHDKNGDGIRAAQQLSKVSSDASIYLDARIFQSNILQERNEPEAAIRAIEELLAAHPESPEGQRRLIALYRESKRFEDAIQVASRLAASDPQNDMYLFSLAFLYDEAGQRDRAINVLREVIRLNPDNGAALNHLGYVFADRGVNLDEAEALVRRALAIHPSDGAFVDSLGWVHYRRGEYEAAVKELERALSLAGHDPVIVEHLGDAYRRVGRRFDAIRTYRDAEARTEDPDQRERLLEKLKNLKNQRSLAGEITADAASATR